MYAALYGDVDSARQLLKNGADPNDRNEAGATALMWATDNLEMGNSAGGTRRGCERQIQ